MAEVIPFPSAQARTLASAFDPELAVQADQHHLVGAMGVTGLDALDPDQIAPPLREPLVRYARLLEATSAPTTLRGRRADVRGYAAWVGKQGLTALPPSPGLDEPGARRRRSLAIRAGRTKNLDP